MKHIYTFLLLLLMSGAANAFKDGVYYCVPDRYFGLDERDSPRVSNWKPKRFSMEKYLNTLAFGAGFPLSSGAPDVSIHTEEREKLGNGLTVDRLVATFDGSNAVISVIFTGATFVMNLIVHNEHDLDGKIYATSQTLTGTCTTF